MPAVDIFTRLQAKSKLLGNLLQNIHRALPPEMANRYRTLMEKRRAEALSAADREGLVSMRRVLRKEGAHPPPEIGEA